MGIRSGMLVLWLCACGVASTDPPLDDGGTGGSGGDGGGGGGGDLGINRSGTRIKMKVLNTPDGAKLFQSSYDTQRNEDCWFQLAADGVTRCLPVFGNVAHGISTGYFADPVCTIPVALASQTCQPPSYIVNSNIDPSCLASRFEIYERGTEAATVYSKTGVGSSCVVVTVDGLRFYRIGTAIPPSSFQMATSAIE